MISFDWIVGILLGEVAGRGQQLIEHWRIHRSPVGAHLGRGWVVLKCVGEEPASGCYIPFLREEDVDDLAELGVLVRLVPGSTNDARSRWSVGFGSW